MPLSAVLEFLTAALAVTSAASRSQPRSATAFSISVVFAGTDGASWAAWSSPRAGRCQLTAHVQAIREATPVRIDVAAASDDLGADDALITRIPGSVQLYERGY